MAACMSGGRGAAGSTTVAARVAKRDSCTVSRLQREEHLVDAVHHRPPAVHVAPHTVELRGEGGGRVRDKGGGGGHVRDKARDGSAAVGAARSRRSRRTEASSLGKEPATLGSWSASRKSCRVGAGRWRWGGGEAPPPRSGVARACALAPPHPSPPPSPSKAAKQQGSTLSPPAASGWAGWPRGWGAAWCTQCSS